LKPTVLALSGGLAALSLVALSACEQGKPRHLPPDPMAVMAPPTGLAAKGPPPHSPGLAKRPEQAAFSIDRINEAKDPLNRQPAYVSAGEGLVFQGFGYDPVAQRPAKGVDVVIDDQAAYGTLYGAGRADVAAAAKNPAVTQVGFKTTLPGGLVPVGPHHAVVRVIAADGKGYFDGLPIAFEVRAGEPSPH
jgi:hypothetical protein